MRTFKSHLIEKLQDHVKEKLQDQELRTLFEEEKEIFRIGFLVAEARAASCLNQAELARKAHITQQQLSRIENGSNCNLATLLKVCRALGLAMVLKSSKESGSWEDFFKLTESIEVPEDFMDDRVSEPPQERDLF
jgi:HTH-type transcriptional regulator / antitoxin HipB